MHRDEHQILDLLYNQLFCVDSLSLPATTQLVSHGVGSGLATNLVNTHLSVYQQVFPGSVSSIDYSLADPDAALQRLKFGEVL